MNMLVMMGYSAMYTIIPESYPVDIRNIGVGSGNTAGKAAAVISPLFTGWLLSQQEGFQVAVSLFAALFALTGIFALFLKETRPIVVKDKMLE